MDNDEPAYRIQWKGQISGPYIRAELEDMLARSQISLLHRVEVNGQWKGVGDLLGFATRVPRPVLTANNPIPANAWDPGLDADERADESESPVEEPAVSPEGSGKGVPVRETSVQPGAPVNTDFIIQAGYVLCGLCFLLPFLATIPALIAAFWLHTQEQGKQAKQLFILAPVLTVLGVIFWLVLWPLLH
jgi:hypothetical protein